MTRQKGAHYNIMYPHFQQIQEYIDSNRENILEMFRTLVNLEGHYKEKENVEQARYAAPVRLPRIAQVR